MIIITINYKGKLFDHKYKGNVIIEFDYDTVAITWSNVKAEQYGDWIRYSSNGFDIFWKDDITSIRGEHDK